MDWKRFRISGRCFVFLFVGGFVGSSLGMWVVWALRIYDHAATAVGSLAVLGACVGFVFGGLSDIDLLDLREGWEERLGLALCILVAVAGCISVVGGLTLGLPGQVVDGLIAVLLPAAWFARNKRGVLPALVCLISAAAFAALAITNGNPLWFIIAALMGLGAVGYYLHRHDSAPEPHGN